MPSDRRMEQRQAGGSPLPGVDENRAENHGWAFVGPTRLNTK